MHRPGLFWPGMVKSTYGTGCFALINTGATPVSSQAGCSLPSRTRSTASAPTRWRAAIFIAGAAVQWLRDGLDSSSLPRHPRGRCVAANAEPDVYLVPAFVGSVRPDWDAECARCDLRTVTRHRAPGARTSDAGVGVLSNARSAGCHAQPTGGCARKRCLRVDGGMVATDSDHAAPRRHPGRGRGVAYYRGPPHWVSLGSRATSPACGPRAGSAKCGGSTATSSRRWLQPSASASTRVGSAPRARYLPTPAAHDATIPARSLAPAVVAGGPRRAAPMRASSQ